MTTQTMDLLDSPAKLKMNKREVKSKLSTAVLDKFGTGQMLWHITKRHKFGIVLFWAGYMTLVNFVPFFNDLVISFVTSMLS